MRPVFQEIPGLPSHGVAKPRDGPGISPGAPRTAWTPLTRARRRLVSPHFMESILEQARLALGADGALLMTLDESGRRLRPAAAAGVGPALAALERRPPKAHEGFLGRLVRSTAPRSTHVLRGNTRLVGGPSVRGDAVATVAGVSLRAARRPEGCLVATWRARRRVEPAETRLLQLLGRLMGTLVSMARHPSPDDRMNRSRQLRAFSRISRLASVAEGAGEIGPRVLEEFCRALGFTRGEIWLFGPEPRRMRLYCTHGQSYSLPPKSASFRDCPFTMMLLKRRQGIHHPNVCADPASQRRWAPWNRVTSVFGAPLRTRGKTIGTLIADRQGQPFDMSATELEVAGALTTLLAEVIDGALERRLKAKRHQQMILLNRVNRAIGTESRLPMLLTRVPRIVRAQIGCVGVVVRLHDEPSGMLRVVAASGPGARRLLGQFCPTRRGKGSLAAGALSFLANRPIVVNHATPLGSTEAYWPGVRSALVIPIRIRQQAAGVLRLEATERFTFDEGDIRVYSILAEQIGHAIERSRTIETLRRKQSELRAVSESLERGLEEDRRRIARELHDELAQSMTAVKMNLGLLRDLTVGAGPEVARLLGDTETLLNETIAETRRISMDLRPAMLDELGLLPALRWYAGHVSNRTGIRVALRARGAESRIRRELETLLYRFVQEALTNVVRHARAKFVRIDLVGRNGSMIAAVSDDGVGLAANGSSHKGLGLLGMRERIERIGGSLRITSRRGLGTRLEAVIPLAHTAGARIEPERSLGRRNGRMAKEHESRVPAGTGGTGLEPWRARS